MSHVGHFLHLVCSVFILPGFGQDDTLEFVLL